MALLGTPTGQWLDNPDGSRWWFDSGSLALDFAYTGALTEIPEWDGLRSTADLGDWLASRFPGVDREVSERDLLDALALRDAIAETAVAVSGGRGCAPRDVDVINLYAATPDIPPALAGGTRQAGASRYRASQALSAMAREAVSLFAPDMHVRIRRCAADDCGIVFVDESRSNNRRWCSMQRCGNRAKVRKYRASEA